MGYARIIKRFSQPIVGTIKAVGGTTYAVAGAVDYANAAQSGNAGAQAILGLLPGFAIVKGVFDIVDGLAMMGDHLNGDHLSNEELECLCVRRDPAENPMVLIRPTVSYGSSKLNYVRGGLKALTGLFLVDGGIEAYTKTDLFHFDTLAGSHSLLWRMAISSYVDFALAFQEACSAWVVPTSRRMGGTDTWKKLNLNIISELLIKGCAAIGWTALAIGDPIGVPLGLAFLALSVASTLLKNQHKIAFFFKNLAASCGVENTASLTASPQFYL